MFTGVTTQKNSACQSRVCKKLGEKSEKDGGNGTGEACSERSTDVKKWDVDSLPRGNHKRISAVTPVAPVQLFHFSLVPAAALQTVSLLMCPFP